MARTSRKDGRKQSLPETQNVIYNAALYVRLSVFNSKEESILNQQALLERFVAERPELILKSIFADNGETGVNFLRPAWNALIGECRAGKINCIVVKDLSRVGRNYIETGEYLEKIFPLLGVRLIAVNDGYDNLDITTGEQLAASLKNLVNDIYAKDISRKVKSALHTKQRNGDFIGSYAAYGYLKAPGNKHKLIVDFETAPIIGQIFKWKAEGLGNAQICRRLNAAGLPCPSRYRFLKGILKDERFAKCQWHTRTIDAMLHNTVYLGNMAQGEHLVEGTHEPIVTRELFDEAHSVMERRSGRYKAVQGKYAHLKKTKLVLKGLVFCADCGKPLYRYKSVNSGGKYCDWIYLCRTDEIIKACPRKYIHESVLNRAVYEALRVQIQIGGMEGLSRENDYKSRHVKFDAEREIRRCLSLRQAAFEDYAAKKLTASEYKHAIAKYDREMAKQHRRNESARLGKAKYAQRPIWLADVKELTCEMAHAFIERVEISNRNRVTITFNFRDELKAAQKQGWCDGLYNS